MFKTNYRPENYPTDFDNSQRLYFRDIQKSLELKSL